ncbi:nucleotidyltransferase domain-containing protein [Natronospora cellulosivora (SeqCode)]
MINDLKIKENNKLAILFGSQARGDYNDNSDVDIAS